MQAWGLNMIHLTGTSAPNTSCLFLQVKKILCDIAIGNTKSQCTDRIPYYNAFYQAEGLNITPEEEVGEIQLHTYEYIYIYIIYIYIYIHIHIDETTC